MATAGYSGTPLGKKLGIKTGFTIRLYNAPAYYFDLFTDLPEIEEVNKKGIKKDFIHYFVTGVSRLHRDMPGLRKEITENGIIWISWPKKASKVETDVNENIIRDVAIRNGLVDVKVAAIDDVWSGLKLVIPVKLRKLE